MGSVNDKGRDRGPNGRRGSNERRRQARPNLEGLEQRTLLTGMPDWKPTVQDVSDLKNGPLANAGPELLLAHQQYDAYTRTGQKDGFATSALNTQRTLLKFRNDYVGVSVNTYGDFNKAVANLQGAGMIVGGVAEQQNIVEGYLPISQLVNVATMRGEDAGTIGMNSQAFAISRSQGAANNQAEQGQLADTAKNLFNVTGAGVTVGVLSTSVDKFAGGLADSIGTGDLPGNVNVLFDNDGTALLTDEGRAMLEHVYDIAPGAGLAYHNGFSDAAAETVLATGVRRLATEANAKVIVDDIGFRDGAYYQDGIAAVAITDVRNNNGVSYFSAAGNSANAGYESPFRGVTGTVTGVGAGRFMDFDPSATQALAMPIIVETAGQFVLQYDNPWFVTNGVTSDVDVFVLDANNGVVASAVSNNIATNRPQEIITINTPGNYRLAVRINSGSPDITRLALYSFSSTVDFASAGYGNAGGISYPTTFGHPTADASIGVGAVAWYDAPAFPSGKSPVPSEDFSAFGPSVKVFNADGTRKATVQFQQSPVLSGNDAANVSFAFGNPPGGVPAGLPANNYNQYNFFGTSAAAPNVAAVAALMYELAPNTSTTDIRNGLIASTIPLNGSPKGTWDVQGGFGLVQANSALTAIDRLRVVSASPATATTVETMPTSLVLRFSRAVNTSTLQASDLVFTGFSQPGISVTVGTPSVSATEPDLVTFPLTVNVEPGRKANATFSYSLLANSISSQDGKALVAFNGSFTVNDTVAPRVTSTSFIGRIVSVQFSEAMNPASFTRDSIYLIRTGSSGVFGHPSNVTINQDPRIVVRYDSTTNSAIIDLTAVDQSILPGDRYGLVVLDTVTDVARNRLDGEFSNVFPSGNGTEGANFFQDLGVIGLTAPQFSNFGLDAGVVNVRPNSDTGITGDQNTNLDRPWFSGQVTTAFPGATAGLQLVAQFSGLRSGGTLSLEQGLGGRGFTGADGLTVSVTTDATGRFLFQAPANLPDGFQSVRVIVVGASDAPPLPGLSTVLNSSFRVDKSNPVLTPGTIQPDARLGSLSSVVINVRDEISAVAPYLVPTQFGVPALNPATATNISNYALTNLGSDNAVGGTGTAADVDYSGYITSSVFATVGQRTQPTDPYLGTITLSFAAGLPSGRYILTAKQSGITDAAGNRIFGATSADRDFTLPFDLQPTPIYITSVQAATPNPNGTFADPDTRTAVSSGFDLSGPKSYFELAVPGQAARATAAPTKFSVDFSSPLGGNVNYTGRVFLIRAGADGDFGTDPSFQNGVGYTIVPTTVTAINSVVGAEFGDPGFRNRLLIEIEPGTSLPADHYRLYIPNAVRSNGDDLRIFDVFGNQLDGEFLGNPTPSGDGTYETLLGTGEIRANSVSGDGVMGGAFETGYLVVPNGNVLFVRPDYLDDQGLSGDDPDGSFSKPFSTLAPEAAPNAANGGDLNSAANFGTGFDARYDRNGNGRFDRSVFVAAAERSALGPVVIIAQPSSLLPSRTFVLQAPSGTDPIVNDGSATVPYNTTVVFQPGSILKFRNASLYVQNQGSALQVRGGQNPQSKVIFTSYSDDSAGGDTNRDGSSSSPQGADWGGIVFRNYDDTTPTGNFPNGRPIPEAPGPFDPLRAKLGVSGADDALSYLNHATIRFAGGAVPQTIGFRYDAITTFNARPSITNVTISQTGGVNGAQAAISGDVDSFREDDLARGILVRRTTLSANSINGIYIRANLNGVAQPTNAITYVNNPSSLGGSQNYAFFAPLPYVLVSRLEIGRSLVQSSGGQTQTTNNRFYFQPGTVMKFQRGAAIDVVNRNASINIGDRTYIRQFDANNNFAPTDAGFRAADFGDAPVLFTSFFDDNATTAFRNPVTGALTTVVAPLDSDNGGTVNLPVANNVPALSRWGGISIISGTVSVIDEATFQFGGGSVNSAGGTIGQRDVLAFQGAGGNGLGGLFLGTRSYVTNNNFFDNQQAPISIDPNGLLSTDPLRPLVSGNPFFRGNLMLRNDLNGLEVLPDINNNGTSALDGNGSNTTITYSFNDTNQFVSTVWDDTDLTYLLRSTIRLAGFERQPGIVPLPAFPTGGFLPELRPSVVLTIQSSLPDSLLASGQRIARPGESALVKLMNTSTVIGDALNGVPFNDVGSNDRGGAGFMAGIDNGVDDPAVDTLIDGGYLSQIRITGIGGNETTGQQRVPVIITSLRDDTVGKTVRGVDMFVARNGNTTAPAPGDGGLIAFGALGLSDYNLYDPRDGSIIDNADIRYITRIEQQGGGWVYNVNGGTYADRAGTTPATQYNTAKAMTLSNSNLSNFSQVGFIAHPSLAGQLSFFQSPPPDTPFFARSAPLVGQPTLTFFVNNTFSNMLPGTVAGSGTGVRIVTEPSGDNSVTGDSPAEAVFLNNSFHNNAVGIHAQAPNATGLNPLSHVHMLAMNNIFSTHSDVAIRAIGQSSGSQGQYNLFSNNTANTNVVGGSYIENQPIFGNADFQDPANGLFNLLASSDAIDSSRSEIGPITLGISLQPIVTQVLDGTGGIRRATGRTNTRGVFGNPTSSDIVSLPGYTLRNFEDQWVPAITGTPAIPGPNTNNGGTYSYIPIDGERDQAGYLRIDDPSKGNVGFGSRPFFDAGASEFRVLNPPNITAVTAIVSAAVTPETPDGRTEIPFYSPGNVLGSSQTPRLIIIKFDERLDPATVNNRTIILQAAGGDAIFDNGNDRLIDLSGKLVYDEVLQTVSLALADSNLTLGNDVYRIQVFGSGGNVIRDADGLALDGENTVNGQSGQPSLPLPSGNGFPGGNFFLTFTIDSIAPEIVDGTFVLAASSDTAARDNVTSNNRPSFEGTISDVAPPTNPLLNQTVYIDVSTLGNGVFDRLGVAQGTTDATGRFTATYVDTTALADSPRNVGPDGKLGTADDIGFSVARVRIVDQSGNTSNLSDASGLIRIFIDTKGPKVVGSIPTQTSQVEATGGVIPVTIAFNENVPRSAINATSLTVTRSVDGVFGNGDDLLVAIDPLSIQLGDLDQGQQFLRFNITGANASDVYRVRLSGTAGSGVTDIAGNLLDGEGTGLPSGDGTAGGDFNLDFIVFNPTVSRFIYVSQFASSGGNGSRSTPYNTIADGIAAAVPGDTVAVLPGVYTEIVTLKSLVKVVSAASSSTSDVRVPGNALQTVIRAPGTGATATVTVTASNLVSIAAFQTEFSGFTVASPLVGDPSRGPINTASVGLYITNSDILVSKNYFIDSGSGVRIGVPSGASRAPVIQSNGFIGNYLGLEIIDSGATQFNNGHNITVANNTFAFNTVGLYETTILPQGLVQIADVVNNIFWQNADRSGSRQGAAIAANSPNRMGIRNNLFSGNGPSDASPADDLINVGSGVNPANLSPTPDAFGNFTGNPAFVAPIDPRPDGNGPGNFFQGASYALTLSSAAIDVALASSAPLTDFQSLYRVDIANRGRAGVGPADIGAFEFNGSPTPVVASNSIAPVVAPTPVVTPTPAAQVPRPSKFQRRQQLKRARRLRRIARRAALQARNDVPKGPLSLVSKFRQGNNQGNR